MADPSDQEGQFGRKDFSDRRWFPGTSGNPLDKALHAIDRAESIPVPLFALLLLGLACVPFVWRWHPGWALGLWAFMLGDFVLLHALPARRISFGPARPAALVLGCLRVLVALLPVPLAFSLQLVGTGLVCYAFWVEPRRLHLTRQSLTTLKAGFSRPLRLLHIGDLHVERITGRERALNRLIAETRPDLILFSGDFLNLSYLKDPQAQQDLRAVLQEWSAPLGVYAVTGSPAVDLPELFPALLAGTPVQRLDNERVTLYHEGKPFDLLGLTCTHKPFLDGPCLAALGGGFPDRFTILLYHSPDLAPEASSLGIDLQLSGHTHGGQVRLPGIGALFTGSLYGKRFEVGRVQVGSMALYVTRGVGLEGASAPRVRFLCPPEVVLWEIN